MSRILRIEIGRFDYDVVGEFKFLKPGPDGRVRRPTVMVRLTDEDGVSGWGQAVPTPTWTYETAETVMTTLEAYLAPVLIGLDPADVDAIHARMNEAIRPAFSVGQPLCKAAVDIACHDLVARRRQIPVHQLLGASSCEPLELSWTVASPDMAVAEAQLAEGWERGYRNFNIKVGAPQTLAYDIALAQRVRQFAPEAFLWADANTGYTVAEALEAAPKLAEAGVDILESPLPPNRLRGYQELRKQGALPVLMDEGILSPVEVEEFIALGMLDGVAMKPARNAGLGPSKRIISLLQEHGLCFVGSGLTDPDLSLAASLHLYGWGQVARPCALNGPQFLTGGFGGEALKVQEGRLAVPAGPGLGIEPDERAVRALRVVANG